MSEVTFARGFYFDPPKGNAPDYVLGKVSINKEQFLGWLESQDANEKGYVRLDVKRSKDGKIYAALDTWKPNGEKPRQSSAADYRAAKEGTLKREAAFNDDIPFAPYERGYLA